MLHIHTPAAVLHIVVEVLRIVAAEVVHIVVEAAARTVAEVVAEEAVLPQVVV